jgi:hypothetical protein
MKSSLLDQQTDVREMLCFPDRLRGKQYTGKKSSPAWQPVFAGSISAEFAA